MTFLELTKNPIVINSVGESIEFFKELEKLCSGDYENIFEEYINYGHYVILCDGLLELFSDGHIEVREYNRNVYIFKIVELFKLYNIELCQRNDSSK